jgi:hypothetical protein
VTDFLAHYIDRLARTNRTLRHWRAYSEQHHDAAAQFASGGVSMWDLHLGRLAPVDLFAATPAAEGPRQGRVAAVSAALRDRFRRLDVPGRGRVERNGVVVLAFQRRQLTTFDEVMRELTRNAVPATVLTTCFPASAFSGAPEAPVRAIESYLRPRASMRASREARRLAAWLDGLVRAAAASEREEASLVVAALKTRLRYGLLMLAAARAALRRLDPRAVIGADDSDLRARAVYLTARRMGIPSYHIPYGYMNYDTYEETYPTADVKLVFGEQQRALLVEHFGVPASRLDVIGAPRFDGLFHLRRGRPPVGQGPLTILFGSQTCGTSTYSPLTMAVKTTALEALFRGLSSGNPQVRVLYRPHPEETPDERADVHRLARAAGLELIELGGLDFAHAASSVDVFVTFFSTLALEFLILGVPVCYLTSVSSIAVLKATRDLGVARELTSERQWRDLAAGGRPGLEASFRDPAHFVDQQFANPGRASAALAAVLSNQRVTSGPVRWTPARVSQQ